MLECATNDVPLQPIQSSEKLLCLTLSSPLKGGSVLFFTRQVGE